MTEDTLIALLTQQVKPLLRDLPPNASAETREAIAGEIAEAAWSGLAILLRHSLARGEPAALEEIGHFERTRTGIRFVPAASLLEAASLRDAPADAHAWMVERAVLYLEEGAALLQSVPPEARRLPGDRTEAELTPEQKMLRSMLKRPIDQDPLAAHLSRVAHTLTVMLRRIETAGSGSAGAPAEPRAPRGRQRRGQAEGAERQDAPPATAEGADPTGLTMQP
jgi:hypothetical protein